METNTSLVFGEAKLNNPVIQCKYCNKDIDFDDPGWGFNNEREFFHVECAQMDDDIKLPMEEDRSEDWKPKT